MRSIGTRTLVGEMPRKGSIQRAAPQLGVRAGRRTSRLAGEKSADSTSTQRKRLRGRLEAQDFLAPSANGSVGEQPAAGFSPSSFLATDSQVYTPLFIGCSQILSVDSALLFNRWHASPRPSGRLRKRAGDSE